MLCSEIGSILKNLGMCSMYIGYSLKRLVSSSAKISEKVEQSLPLNSLQSNKFASIMQYVTAQVQSPILRFDSPCQIGDT